MSRVRRRVARDRRDEQTTAEERAYFRWHADDLRRRCWAALNPATDEAAAIRSEAIRIRRVQGARWDRLRAAGLSIPEAQRAMRAIPEDR